VNFADIPLFIEANNNETRETIQSLATALSPKVYYMEGEKTPIPSSFGCVLHAILPNHMYTLAADILENEGIPYDVLKPLIEETAEKVKEMSPRNAQNRSCRTFSINR
jgi:hypothetical protein